MTNFTKKISNFYTIQSLSEVVSIYNLGNLLCFLKWDDISARYNGMSQLLNAQSHSSTLIKVDGIILFIIDLKFLRMEIKTSFLRKAVLNAHIPKIYI